MKIPEYYRQNISKPVEQPKQDELVEMFQGNSFTLEHPEDWQDKTIYTLTGPVTDGKRPP